MSQLNYPHIASLAFNKPLLATAELTDIIANFLAPRVLGVLQDNQQISAKNVQTYPVGNPNDNQNIAIISVHGILVPRRGLLSDACEEITSYELIRNQLQAALASDNIKEIILDINSGGGSAQGAFELAAFIREATAQKKITALVNHNAYSAAYLIASACSEIVLSATSGVGSIGVYQKRLDLSAALEQKGIVMHTFYRGACKVFFHPDIAIGDDERAHIESGIEETYQDFINAVATYRGLSAEAVQATEADCFNGQKAIDLGLADTLSDAQSAVNTIVRRLSAPTNTPRIQARAAALTL
jgi:signal peptide peptidase SppA